MGILSRIAGLHGKILIFVAVALQPRANRGFFKPKVLANLEMGQPVPFAAAGVLIDPRRRDL
jgi:hypothetical protein